MITNKKALISTVIDHFQLGMQSPHGPRHWGRVNNNGLKIAEHTQGVDIEVVELFSLLHDCCRIDDHSDPFHGKRAALFAAELRGDLFELPDSSFETLSFACEFHTNSKQVDDITVKACWDADRLDLFRIGIEPNPDHLFTDYAKTPEMIRWAMNRSER